MSWDMYYNGQRIGSGLSDDTKSQISTTIDEGIREREPVWIKGLHPDGSVLELLVTPGVPFWWYASKG